MVRRGEVYYVDRSPGRGSEQSGILPALVIQNNVGNQFSPTTIVTAISTQRGKTYPFQVPIVAQEGGLPRESIVKCEQIQTINQARLGPLVGVLSMEKMQEVDLALKRSLELS